MAAEAAVHIVVETHERWRKLWQDRSNAKGSCGITDHCAEHQVHNLQAQTVLERNYVNDCLRIR